MTSVNERIELPVWQAFVDRHQVGDRVEGVVSSLVPFGAFVNVGDGVDGLLHESVWHSKPQMGSAIEVELAAIDAENRRLSLRPA